MSRATARRLLVVRPRPGGWQVTLVMFGVPPPLPVVVLIGGLVELEARMIQSRLSGAELGAGDDTEWTVSRAGDTYHVYGADGALILGDLTLEAAEALKLWHTTSAAYRQE